MIHISIFGSFFGMVSKQYRYLGSEEENRRPKPYIEYGNILPVAHKLRHPHPAAAHRDLLQFRPSPGKRSPPLATALECLTQTQADPPTSAAASSIRESTPCCSNWIPFTPAFGQSGWEFPSMAKWGCTVRSGPRTWSRGTGDVTSSSGSPLPKSWPRTARRNNTSSSDAVFHVFCADQVEGKVADNFRSLDEPAAAVLPDYVAAEELIAATGANIASAGPGLLLRSGSRRSLAESSGRRFHLPTAETSVRSVGGLLGDAPPWMAH